MFGQLTASKYKRPVLKPMTIQMKIMIALASSKRILNEINSKQNIPKVGQCNRRIQQYAFHRRLHDLFFLSTAATFLEPPY